MGYHRAGFEVVGVDHKPQPRYPFDFQQADALEWLKAWVPGMLLSHFDAIHASPPCQRWTRAQRHRKNESAHPDLITPLRPLLEDSGLPYVIENVEFCDVLRNPALVCGSMFDMDIQNHRLFETNWQLQAPTWPCRHKIWGRSRYPGTPLGIGKPKGTTAMVVNRMASGVTHEMLAEAMGIDWIPAGERQRPSQELSDALPPAFTQFVGIQLKAHLSPTNPPAAHRLPTNKELLCAPKPPTEP